MLWSLILSLAISRFNCHPSNPQTPRSCVKSLSLRGSYLAVDRADQSPHSSFSQSSGLFWSKHIYIDRRFSVRTPEEANWQKPDHCTHEQPIQNHLKSLSRLSTNVNKENLQASIPTVEHTLQSADSHRDHHPNRSQTLIVRPFLLLVKSEISRTHHLRRSQSRSKLRVSRGSSQCVIIGVFCKGWCSFGLISIQLRTSILTNNDILDKRW